MKIAAIQLGSSSDKERSLDNARRLIIKAAKSDAEFISLPEVFNYRGSVKTKKEREQIAEKASGVTISLIKELAKQYRVNILAGSIYERVDNNKKVYNTSFFIDNKGNVLNKYRKINLFDAVLGKKKVQESKTFLPGDKLTVVKVKNFKLGLSVCYDLRFGNLYRSYAKKNVDIMCVPSAFTLATGKAHWEVLLRARAIENLSYVIAPNQIGTDHRGIRYYGNSLIVDPWGKVLARGSSNKEQILYAKTTKKELQDVRKILPKI